MLDRRSLLGVPLLPFLPSPASAEYSVDKVQRLTEELSLALDDWAEGKFCAKVYPMGDQRGIHFLPIGPSNQSFIAQCCQDLSWAARASDPLAEHWRLIRATDDRATIRFQLSGSALPF